MAHAFRQMSLLMLLALLMSTLPLAQPVRAATTWTVTKPNDTNDGACNADCSFREALTAAQNGDTIVFGNGATAWTIQVSSTLGQLPALSQGNLTINAGTNRTVILDGTVAGDAFGLRITSANNVIRGLVINNFSGSLESNGGSGILLSGTNASNNRIYGCLIGVAANGTDAAGNNRYGIFIIDGASNNIIGGTGTNEPNVIAGNNVYDILISRINSASALSQDNQIVGNLIGTNSSGSARITDSSPALVGVAISDSARNTVIGPGNVISGYNLSNSAAAGISLFSNISNPDPQLPTGTRIIGNRIGTNAAGTAAIANTNGILLAGFAYGAVNTTIGGSNASDRNVIAGNSGAGIQINNTFPIVNTVITNNYIGLAANGSALGNSNEGVLIANNDADERVTIGPGNVISANGISTGAAGIRIRTNNNIVRGNYIATNIAGTASSGFVNGSSGVRITEGTNNVVGGTTTGPNPGDGNVIGVGASQPGVSLLASSSGTTVQGNYIGLNAAGTDALNASANNDSIGLIINGSTGNTILNNVISANGYGISLQGAANNNQIRGNYIGADKDGNFSNTGLGNRSDGIQVIGGTGNVIGGTNASDRNLIVRNGRRGLSGYHGIRFSGTNAANNRVEGNLLAFNGATTNSTGNGVFVSTATGITISRTETTGNLQDGIALDSNGNNSRAAPSGLAVSLVGGQPTLSGTTTCGANCTIEVFTHSSQENGEGPQYVTRFSPTTSNNFSITLPFCQRWLTATVTDAAGNTSPFATMVDGNGQGCPSGAAEPNVQLSAASPNTRTVLPSQTAIYTHTLTNTGTASGNFSIQRNSTQAGWTIQVNPTSVTLGAGQSTSVVVTVTPPAGTGGLSDQTTIRASVTTGSGTRQSDPQTDTTNVTKTFGVEITPDNSGSVTPGPSPVSIDYNHTIRNTGNGPDTITLSATSTAPSVSTSFPDGASCSNLAAGATCTRRVRVTVAANSTDTFDTTTVRATASNGSTFDEAVDTTTIRQSAVPQITPSAQTRDALPTNSAVFTYTIRNIGQATGTFTVTVPTVPAGWTVTLNPAAPASFSLGPNATRIVTLTMQMPTSPIPDANSTHSAQIRVDSSDGGFATATATTRVLLRPAFSFSPATQPTLNNVAPGQTVVFTHTLTNNGNGADNFTITVTPTAGLTLLNVTPANPISLARNASTAVVVRAQVNTATGAGAQTLTVTAQTNSTPQPAAISRIDTVNVVAAAFPQLSPGQTKTANPGDTVTFTHTLTNVGNQAAVFTLTLNAPVAWNAQIISSNCPVSPATLGVGSSCQFTVQVTIPADTVAGSYPNLTITASADGNSASVTDTVVVSAVARLQFAPNYTGNARGSVNPGQVITYTHTLTNTGNASDSFTLTLGLSQADQNLGWSATVSPTLLSNVPRNGTRTVQVAVRGPTGVAGGIIGTVTVTATSTLSTSVRASVVDETQLNSIPGAELTPPAQTGNAQPSATNPDTVTFFHTLRNSGSATIAYTLSSSNSLGWTSVVSPTTVGPLAPGQTATIAVQVTAPAGTANGTQNVTTIEVRQQGGPATVLASARDTTVVGPQIGILIDPPLNVGTALPGATIFYTHTLTNIGSSQDIFVLSTVPSLGWDTEVTPPFANLGPNESVPITVTVRVPTSVLSGTLDIATLIARSTTDPTIFGTAEERTTILQVAAASLSPSFFRSITPNSQVTFNHTLVNTGNGRDTFTLTASDELGWPVSISPASLTLRPGRSSSAIVVTVQVPRNLAGNTTNRITVSARSRSNPNAVITVRNVLNYPQVQSENRLYLPLVVR